MYIDNLDCPLFEFSPEGRTVPQTSEEAIIRSLGITAADDSGISWTSSLATPSHLPPSTGTDDRQGGSLLDSSRVKQA